MHPQHHNVTCNESLRESGANDWGAGGIKIQAKTHVPKTQAPEDGLLPPQASGSIQEAQSKISPLNRSTVRLQESMDTDWKLYRRADTFTYHLTRQAHRVHPSMPP